MESKFIEVVDAKDGYRAHLVALDSIERVEPYNDCYTYIVLRSGEYILCEGGYRKVAGLIRS